MIKSTESKLNVHPLITAIRISEATRGDPFLSRVLHYVLHGWPAEENTPEEFRFYRAKREELTVEDVFFIAWYKRSNTLQISTRSANRITSKPPRNAPNEVFGTTACLVAKPGQ